MVTDLNIKPKRADAVNVRVSAEFRFHRDTHHAIYDFRRVAEAE
jgi:hypothetical protein